MNQSIKQASNQPTNQQADQTNQTNQTNQSNQSNQTNQHFSSFVALLRKVSLDDLYTAASQILAGQIKGGFGAA